MEEIRQHTKWGKQRESNNKKYLSGQCPFMAREDARVKNASQSLAPMFISGGWGCVMLCLFLFDSSLNKNHHTHTQK